MRHPTPSTSALSPRRGEGINHSPILPPPPTFGVDESKFSAWRPGQDQAVDDIIMSDKRFIEAVNPTGAGKSLIYICAAVMNGGRTLILTSTNGLSQQIMTDFGNLCVQVKGKSNYRCKKLGRGATCDRGPCNHGKSCAMKESGCAYYDAVKRAAQADIVVTNYAFWIYNNKVAVETGNADLAPIGHFDMIVCDEAHDCPNKVADAFTVRFSRRNEVEKYLLDEFNWTTDHNQLLTWIHSSIHAADGLLADAKRLDMIERAHQAANALKKLKSAQIMCLGDDAGQNVIIVPEKQWGVLQVALAWPFDRAHEVLFKDVGKVVLTSATVRPKTLEMLDVNLEEMDLFEYPHIIPLDRRMLYHIKTVRMNQHTSPIEIRTWLTKIDQIIKPRAHLLWNGIVHPVSYDRKNMIIRRSKHRDIMMSHGRKDAQQVIEKFKQSAGHVLVSPSVTTGYDFPDHTARYQIIGKIAFPDTSDPITKSRCKYDQDYSPYIAMQTLVQTVGRIVRSPTDWGESFIIDDNIGWFRKKYGHFAPDWFTGSYKFMTNIPQPYRERS